jgi:hypothetical protein
MTTEMPFQQTMFPDHCPVSAAVDKMAASGSAEARGAVYTKQEVVDFILDLVQYTSDRPLHELSLLEPSCGDGDFLFQAVDRLLLAWRGAGSPGPVTSVLGGCIRAVELHRTTFVQTREVLAQRLAAAGLSQDEGQALSECWMQQGDFLLAAWQRSFDVVVGNPPYVRQEMIPGALLAEYRRRYATLYDRADLYVPFMERSLQLLREGGSLAFICSDRWMKNRYGGPLRALVSGAYRLKVHVDMTDTPAFLTDVTAYPAISVISRESAGPTRVAVRPKIEKAALAQLAERLTRPGLDDDEVDVRQLHDVAVGDRPWVLTAASQVALVRQLESRFPLLEATGCRVGIGVATGADQAFIGPFDELDVEASRKLPLATTKDISSGHVNWRGLGVINPFEDEGGLVDLSAYPRLNRYLEGRREQIARRHVARKSPDRWFRTIDRIVPALACRPKLLIPDINGQASVVYEAGTLYPHHNLYYVVSDEWDLHALQAVLLSGVARLFVTTYSTRMRGGFLRYQAQYLRRIRLPRWADVKPEIRRHLASAAQALDKERCNALAMELYGLDVRQRRDLEAALASAD